MKIVNCSIPKSSFLSIEKDFSILIDKILSNDRIQKLLFYNSKDCLEKPKVNPEDAMKMFGRNIRITPKLLVDSSVLTYIFVRFDNFVPNETNPEFRDNDIYLDIMCHFSSWELKDFQLRPYRIAAELDSMLDKQRLTGIGRLEFRGAEQNIIDDEFGGVSLVYRAIHGEEDKKDPLNPLMEEILFD